MAIEHDPVSAGVTAADASATAVNAAQEILQVVETRVAEPFVGELFRRKFGGAPPDYPRHFVALYAQRPDNWQAVGYVHFWHRKNAFMGGGLVIEDRAYRRMPAAHRGLIKSRGGIAQHLLSTSIQMLPDSDVVWGYVGDSRAEKVDLSVGFVHTHIDKIMAYWKRDFSADERRQLTEEIATVGPF